MLKGKKALYILLPLVAFIWGAIVFQVVGAFSDDDLLLAKATEVTITDIKEKEREVFTLGEIKRDPFLGTLYKPKKKIIKPIARVKKPTITWPSIIYKGMVSGQSNANAIYLVQINGAEHLMKKRQTAAEVTLVRAGASSIRLKYKGKIKDFKIAN